MRTEPVLASVCAVAIVLAAGRVASAQSLRVAVIHAAQQDEAARRLRAEILAAGFEVIDVAVSPLDTRSTAKIAHEAGAVAALRTRVDGDLELLVIDLEMGSALDSVVLPEEPEMARLEVRAVEDLRAKLVELSITPGPNTDAPRSAPEPTTVPSRPGPAQPSGPPPVHDAPPRNAVMDHSPLAEPGNAPRALNTAGVWLQAAAGGALNSGGLGDNAVWRLGVRWESSPRWSVSGLALLPLTGQKVVTAQGTATVGVRVFGAMLGVVPLRSPTLDFEFALGGGAARCTMRGVPENPSDEGRSLSVWTGVGIGELSLAWNAASWLRLRLAMAAGAAAPRVAVSFDGERVATWGRPLALGTLGVELAPLFLARGGP